MPVTHWIEPAPNCRPFCSRLERCAGFLYFNRREFRWPLESKTGGCTKGTPNRVTTEFRETVQQVLDANKENVGRWLTMVAEGIPANGLTARLSSPILGKHSI